MSERNGPGDGGARVAIDERLTMMRDGVINYSGTLISGLLGIALLPIILRTIGAAEYGFWIAVLAIVGMVGTFDFGLSYAVTRAVAASSSATDGEIEPFVRSVGTIYVVIGLAGGVITAILSLPLRAMLHLPANVAAIAPTVCWIAGAYCFSQTAMAFGNSVLNGTRRFDLSSEIAVGTSIARAVSIVMVVSRGGGLIGVGVCYAATALLGAVITLVVAARLRPQLALRLYIPRWEALRAHAEFSIVGQAGRSVNQLLLETAPPLLIGAILGPSAIVPFNIGQKVPLAFAQLGGSSAQVMFSHAGGYAHSRDALRDFIRAGTRWMVLLLVGPAIILSVLAPNILHAWMGDATTTMVLVMEISLLDVVATGIGEGAVNALWALGAARAVLGISAIVAVPSLLTTVLLLRAVGVAGAAWGLLVATSLASWLFFAVVARKLAAPARTLTAGAFKGMAVPALASLGVAFALRYLVAPAAWPGVLASVFAAGVTYAAALYYTAARDEEAALIREIATFPVLLWRWARQRGRVPAPHPAPPEVQP